MSVGVVDDPTKNLRKQRSDVVEAKLSQLKDYDMWALGITIVIGGQYFAWNAGLSAGFGSFFIATFLIAVGYLCLVLCIAELSSGLPFAGGSYGLARVTAGIFPGYLVACFDSIESIIYVATSTVSIGQMLTAVLHTSPAVEPVYWVVFYLSAIAISSVGGVFFWRVNMFLAIISFLIVIMYILGSAKFANFENYAVLDNDSGGSANWFAGGGLAFMKILPIPCWFFVGVESINLASQDVTEPKKVIPRGYVSCIVTLLITCVGVMFVSVSLPPGLDTTAGYLAIFNKGWKLMFHCSEEVAFLLSLPALYATAFGFLFCYGRQLRSMGNSGLINTTIGKSIEGRNTPGIALAAGSLVSFGICLVVYFVPYIGLQLFNVCMLGAYNAYFAQFFSYYVFNTRLCSIKREYKSPLGLAGAVIGASIFFLAMLGIIFFQEDNGFAIIVFLVYLVLVTIYYFTVVIHRQYFSKEESEVLLIAHVMTNNMKRERKHQSSGFTKFLKKLKIYPETKRNHGKEQRATNQGSTLRRTTMNSQCSQVSQDDRSQQYSIGGGDDIEADIKKIKDHDVKYRDQKINNHEGPIQEGDENEKPEDEEMMNFDQPQFTIIGDTEVGAFTEVVHFESIKSVMEEVDKEHSTLNDMPRLLDRVSVKTRDTDLTAAAMFSPRSETQPHMVQSATTDEVAATTVVKAWEEAAIVPTSSSTRLVETEDLVLATDDGDVTRIVSSKNIIEASSDRL